MIKQNSLTKRQARTIRNKFFKGNSNIEDLSTKYFLPIETVNKILKNKVFREPDYIKNYIG